MDVRRFEQDQSSFHFNESNNLMDDDSFFGNQTNEVFAVQSQNEVSTDDVTKLSWLFGGADKLEEHALNECFVGPRVNIVSPWSTNAVEIAQNMCVTTECRIKCF